MDVVAKAVAKGPHIVGEQFTAADVVIGSGLRWGMMFNLIPAYVARLEQRPALQRATALDQALAAA
jgi:glutathione S-transferase